MAEQRNINTMTADELLKQYDCVSFEDFDDVLNYEIMEMFSGKERQS